MKHRRRFRKGEQIVHRSVRSSNKIRVSDDKPRRHDPIAVTRPIHSINSLDGAQSKSLPLAVSQGATRFSGLLMVTDRR